MKGLLKQSLFLICYLCLGFTNAQELPPIQNFTSKNYNAESQNWSISQGPDKYIYVANNSGLLEFTGTSWNIYPTPNNTILRSVKVIGNLIYTGCYMDFGYWQKNNYGSLEYHSLIPKLLKPLIDDEQFWGIISFDNYVLFQSLNRIYIYNTSNSSFQIINSKTNITKIFRLDNSIYFQNAGDGVYKIEKGQAVLVATNDIIKHDIVVGIFMLDKNIVFTTEKHGFYFLENDELKKWEISANKQLEGVTIYSATKLSGGNFILGSISNGIYEVDEKGNLIANINQENGLNNNTILATFEDEEHNLWLGLDNGISVINYNSPISVYNDLNGKIGAVYASVIFNNNLYLGTNQGLFYKTLIGKDNLKLIPNTNGQVWSLQVIDNTLFCGHNLGTFIVEENKARLIMANTGTWNIKPIPNKPELLLQGNYNGLNILEKVGTSWKFRNKIKGFNISSRFFEIVKDNQLFVNHEYKGIYKLKISADFTSVLNLNKENSASKSLKSSLAVYNNDLFYSSKYGIYKFNYANQKFELDSLLTGNLSENDSYISGKLIIDNKTNTLWKFTEKNVIVFAPGKLNSQLKPFEIYLPKSLRNDIVGYENITSLNNDLFLLGSSNGYLKLDLKKITQNDFQLKINGIENGTYNGILNKILLYNQGEFKNYQNNFIFKFSVPIFQKYGVVNYKYQLKGLYNEWSSWSTNSEAEFKNLPYGSYTFNVKAQIGNKISTNVASYSFVILRPWYLSNEMMLLYALLIITLSFLVHTLYKRYYSKQKQKVLEIKQNEFTLSQLENEKLIMKLKNEKLQQEIESKTRELSTSTMNIVKKNELLSTIKQELLNFKESNGIKPVLKIINKNLAKTNDWELFEEAFNNADSDFLKKVKNLHPNLTPNDLRMCAYLRLNLSSKEIAPLLNISARSVEIKRYRLRKKMNLGHQSSLVEYILEI